MQVVDTAILITLILGGVFGLGGITRLFSLLGLFLAISVAVSIYPEVVGLFDKGGREGMGLSVHAFSLLLAFLMALVLFGLVNRALSAAISFGNLKGANQLFGMIVGLALAAFIAGGAVRAAWVFGGNEVREALAASQLAPFVLQFFTVLAGWAERLLPPLEREPW